MMTDASDMLAAALEQMDGIIAGSKALEYSNGLFDCQSPTSPFMGSLRVLHLIEDLRGMLEMMDNRREGRAEVPGARLHRGGPGRVAAESDAVSVLTDQVEAQGEKIRDLEILPGRTQRQAECDRGDELISRTSLETQKLDLMAEISTLKLKLTSVEKDRSDHEDRYKDTEGLVQEMNELRLRVVEMDPNERTQYEKKLKSTKDELDMLKEELELKEADIKKLQEHVDSPLVTAKGATDRDTEVQKMKKAVESLMAANEEKDRKIEELRQALNRYKKVQDMVVLAHGKDVESDDSVISGSNSLVFDSNALSDADKIPLPAAVIAVPQPGGGRCHHKAHTGNAHQYSAGHYPLVQLYVPPITENRRTCQKFLQKRRRDHRTREKRSNLSTEVRTEDITLSPPVKKSSSLDNLKKTVERKPTSPDSGKFETLPPRPPAHGGGEFRHPRKARSSFGRGFFKLKNPNKKTSSTPNLAEAEKGSADHLDLAVSPRSSDGGSIHSSPSSPDSKKKPRGIKKLFGRLKRSQSTTLNQEDDLPEEEFKRGGTRSTAGPRLGWSRDLGQAPSDLDTPFAKWTKEQVCGWLRDQGLGSYVNSCKQWIVSGQTLLHASQQDLEKELGIKHPLHRKKLQLALQSLGSEDDSNYGKLDYKWVTRWLDDIGLPQYKTQFDEAKLDGRMLHYMTVDDLLSLKVVSVLHHLSIKRAIQVLRINSFEPNCLRRRPSEESNVTPSEVAQWTNHRVMEWLRSVDLAEYAPNLRGSGVHGGLMVLEPRFNVETMAQLLNIPPNKTLLRRHLATHFNLLVGQQGAAAKTGGAILAGIRAADRNGQGQAEEITVYHVFWDFTKEKSKKRMKNMCVQWSSAVVCKQHHQALQSRTGLRMLDDEDLDRLESDSEGTVRQIGAFSEGINNLTHMLKEDDMFRDYTARSPSASITDDDSNV
ncbi:unnamed protein product, partial [Ranitomeya imitator]